MLDPGLRYQALINGQADVVVAFGTDGQLARYDLVVLEDDKASSRYTTSPRSSVRRRSTSTRRSPTSSTSLPRC